MREENEIDISYVLSIIKHWWILIFCFMVLGSGIAVIYNYNTPVKYQSNTTVYIEPQVNSNEVDYQGILTNQKMVQTYAEIIQSRTVVNKVIKELRLDTNYETFKKNLSVDVNTDTQILKINFKDQDKIKARDIVNSTADTFIAEIKSKLDVNNISVIDRAIIAKNPVEPKVYRNMAIGILGGMIIGLVLAFLIDAMDNKVKTHEDVKKYLNLKTLGVIPNYSNSKKSKRSKKRGEYSKPLRDNIMILSNPTSPMSEAIRSIRTNLNYSDLRAINVTSTLPSEGKSETIINLALSFSMLDKKVIIVDCDLRKPKVHKNFDLVRGEGVSDVVLSKGNVSYKNVVRNMIFVEEGNQDETKIDVITAGSKVSNPSEIVNSQYFAKLIDELKSDYDLVLIDCPPISNMTDGVVVSKLTDGTIYVIESDKTDYKVIGDCIETLKNNNVFVLGAILTKSSIKNDKKLYGYKYGYYYSDNDK